MTTFFRFWIFHVIHLYSIKHFFVSIILCDAYLKWQFKDLLNCLCCFFNVLHVFNSLDPDLGPNCLQRLYQQKRAKEREMHKKNYVLYTTMSM